MDVAQRHSDRLSELKKLVEISYQHFQKNYERFHEFMRFVFDTALTNEDITKLTALQKPALEFNILESMVNRLLGEFSLQEPSIMVRADDGVPIEKLDDKYIEMLEVLEGYLRETITSPKKDGLQNKLMQDVLGGGFSVAEISTSYINELSFDQKINCNRVFDPTLTGFDPMARESHKGDGNYCFQLFPKTKEEFIQEFGKEAADEIKFARGGFGNFNWSYNNAKQDIVLIAEFFEKKKKKTKIVKLTSGHVVTDKHYKELVEEWNERGFIEQPPMVIESRYTEIESIVRYRLCETKVLSYDETDYRYLPLIFIDGHSVNVRDNSSGAACQMTRPYVYQAKGIQRLKNFSGQTVGGEIEGMVQHKFKVAIEAIPEDFQEAYRNVQQADVLMYNAFYDKNPEVPLPPPQEINRTPTPPLVESTFIGSDRVTQSILGNYDGTLGTNNQDISGVAVANGAIHSNAAATPYLTGYINGLNRIAQVTLDLIPKYYVTPRTLPIKTIDGKRSYKIINNPKVPGSIEINYKPHELDVKVEAGVNSAMQKQAALELMTKMMQASPLFAEFMNSVGLEIIVDNLDIRNADSLKQKASEFMQAKQQAAQESQGELPPEQQAIQAAMEVEMAKIEQRADEAEGKLAIETAKVSIEKEKVNAQVMEIMNDIEMKNAKLLLDQEKVDSENARTAVETVMALNESHLKHQENTNES